MKKTHKKILSILLIMVACFMEMTHGNAQNSLNTTLDMVSPVCNEKKVGQTMNDRYSCSIIIEMSDSWGDGWNGNKLVLSFSDGTPDEELTIENGQSQTDTLEIGNGVHVTMSWINGQYAYECSLVAKYENGDVIYSVQGPSAGVLHEFDCSCPENWNLLNNITLSHRGQLGIATDGNYIYSSSWEQNPAGGYSFYKYDLQGNLIEGFNIPETSEILDLAYDGEFFYGSNESNYLYKMDFTNKTLVSAISTTCTSIWLCTYYPEADGFWVGKNTNLKLINRNGQTIQTAPSINGTSGIAYYKDANYIDHLYLFNQDYNIYDYNITTNTLETDPIFDFENLPGIITNSSGGGAFIGNYNGKTAFFGLIQQSPKNLLGIYELESAAPITPYATVILTAGDIWGDGTGYQMLLDADADTYGAVIPTTGGLTSSGDASPSVYAQFEYKIPESADGSLTTQNIVIDNSIAIQIPAGIYDWCITNPTPDDRMWIAGSSGNIGGRQNDFTFEANKTYEFEIKRFGNNDGVDLTITDNPSSYEISTLSDPSIGGTVNGAGTYNVGATCTLTAIANANFTFSNWTENDSIVSDDEIYTFLVNRDRTLIAHFQPKSYTINLAADPVNAGMVIGGGTYNYGEACTIIAESSTGYTFEKWTKGQWDISTDSIYTFTVTSNAYIVAHFIPNSYRITAIANPSHGGSVTGTGVFEYGETATLHATPYSGYSFTNWTENGIEVSHEANYTFEVTTNRNLVANFTANPIPTYEINVSANPINGGNVSGGGSYEHNQFCTVSATANSGYTFTNWTENGIEVSHEANYTFPVIACHNLVANFSQIVSGYSILANANPIDGGTITGEGIYAQGITCTVTAVANEGYVFKNWTESGVIQCLSEQYTFIVDRDRVLVANFDAMPVFTISSMAGANGTITPRGDVRVFQGNSQTFTMTPNLGGSIIMVLVDGVDIGPVESYTFSNVNQDHTIYVSFSGMGVEEAQAMDINVYPNPANDIVFVEGEAIVSVLLYDLLGNNLRSMDYNSSKALNVSGLPKGIYILKLTTQDGRFGYKKLIVNH